MQEKKKTNKHDKGPSDNSEDPPGDQDGPAEISFEITYEIYSIQDEQNTFQTLTMHGSLMIEVLLYHYHIIVLPN